MVAEIPKHTDILIAAEVSQQGTFAQRFAITNAFWWTNIPVVTFMSTIYSTWKISNEVNNMADRSWIVVLSLCIFDFIRLKSWRICRSVTFVWSYLNFRYYMKYFFLCCMCTSCTCSRHAIQSIGKNRMHS